MAMTAQAYRRQLAQLLPRGPAWDVGSDSNLGKVLLGLADELSRVDGRGGALLDEADPRTTVEMLAEWEQVYGLDGIGSTAEREGALAAQENAQGGCSESYFVGLAADIGLTVTVSGHQSFEVGRSTVGEALSNGDWIYVWQVNAPVLSPELQARLEGLFTAIKPADSIVLFTYA